MTPYLLILFLNLDATVIEFPSARDCLVAKEQIQENVTDKTNLSLGCFKKLGSHKKDS